MATCEELVHDFHDVVMANLLGSGGLQRSQSVVELTHSPYGTRTCDQHMRGPSGPVSACYLACLKQLTMQTVHILQLDIVGRAQIYCPMRDFCKGNPNRIPNEGLTRPSSGAFSHESRWVPTRRHCSTAHTSLQGPRVH
jgi:hypothetical protein